MPDKNETIDIDATAKQIAKELIGELKASGLSAPKATEQDGCPGIVRYECTEKECDDKFTCQPAKKFECSKTFTG